MSLWWVFDEWNISVFKIWNSMILMIMPQGGYVFWYMCICILYNDLMRGHEDLVMLRSTTSPYGRPVIDVTYGEMILSLHWGCMGDDSSGRVVGVSAWCIAHVWHTRVNTSVGSAYIIFWFLRYKNLRIYIYIIFKIYM